MVRSELVIRDYGPRFFAWAGEAHGKIVCVATPQILYDAECRRLVRELIERQGGDCASCRNCILGRDD